MKSKVRNWLQTKLGSRCAGEDDESTDTKLTDEVTDLPFLPNVRQHVLTPSPSTEALMTGSPFFEKLPRELRQGILIRAFGDGLVHMDLSFVHPTAPREPGRPLYSHAGINANNIDTYFPSRVNWDTTTPKSWQWWSSVRHRLLPYHDRSAIDRRRGVREPGDDYCRYGAPHYCPNWPGIYPLKCKIGVMGWLLTCRQAYVEGIHALYGMNTIHMSGQALLPNLPQLLLPQRLSDISSLEIVCPLRLRRGPKSQAIPELDHLESYLAMLSSNFPNLTRLHLALKANGVADRPVDLQGVFDTLDAFVRRQRPILNYISVSPSRSIFTPLYDAIRNAIAAEQGSGLLLLLLNELWRNVNGTYILPISGPATDPYDKRFSSSYPKPPTAGSRTVGAPIVGDGYWIIPGDIDDELPIRKMVCS